MIWLCKKDRLKIILTIYPIFYSEYVDSGGQGKKSKPIAWVHSGTFCSWVLFLPYTQF